MTRDLIDTFIEERILLEHCPHDRRNGRDRRQGPEVVDLGEYNGIGDVFWRLLEALVKRFGPAGHNDRGLSAMKDPVDPREWVDGGRLFKQPPGGATF